MNHPIRPRPEDCLGENFIDLLMLCAREDMCPTGFRLKSRAFVRLAFLIGIDDPTTPKRPVSYFEHRAGCCIDWSAALTPERVMPTVRVGDRFTVDGPSGPITIVEDTD